MLTAGQNVPLPDRRLRVGIVVPVLNESAQIDSLLSNIRAALAGASLCTIGEIIAVDGGSGDDTVAVLRRHGVRVLRAPRGRAAQLETGIRGAHTAEALVLLHADSRLYPTYFIDFAIAIASGEQWGFSPVRLDSPAPWALCISVLMNLRSTLSGICTGDQVMYMRRSAYVAAGGMPKVALMEDVRLAARLRCLSRPCVLPRTVQASARRWRARGVIRTIVLMWLLRLLFAFNVDTRRLRRWYQ